MSTKDLRGKSVRCISHNYARPNVYTPGKVYLIQGVEGDKDLACGGAVLDDGYLLRDDKGDYQYHLDPRADCPDAHGVFEIVEE